MNFSKTLTVVLLATGLRTASNAFASGIDSTPVVDHVVVFASPDEIASRRIRDELAQSAVGVFQISVQVVDHVAYLSGVVDRDYDRRLTIEIAAAVEGVSEVIETIGVTNG